MSKTLRYIFSIAVLISMILNIYTINLLKVKSSKFGAIEEKIDMIMNSTSSINGKISKTTKVDKIENSNDIMTPSELAEYLNINIRQVYKSIIEDETSQFPRLNINGEIRFSKKAIDEYMMK